MDLSGMKKCSTALATGCGALALSAVIVLSTLPVFAKPCSGLASPDAPAEEMSWEKGMEFTSTEAYEKDFDQAIREARKACEAHLGEEGVAIVSDIDETLLDNRPGMIGEKKKNWDRFFAWVNAGKAPPLKKTSDLLKWARDNGFAIFLITGRREKMRRPTIENLIRAKVDYDGLYMRPDQFEGPAASFKTPYRKSIEEMGFKIIVNIGDQYSDLAGGFSENCIKLPNKMYFVE